VSHGGKLFPSPTVANSLAQARAGDVSEVCSSCVTVPEGNVDHGGVYSFLLLFLVSFFWTLHGVETEVRDGSENGDSNEKSTGSDGEG